MYRCRSFLMIILTLGVERCVCSTFILWFAHFYSWGDAMKLLTVHEVAERLAVNPATVMRECRAGKLKHTRVRKAYRFRVQWIDEYIERNSRSVVALFAGRRRA